MSIYLLTDPACSGVYSGAAGSVISSSGDVRDELDRFVLLFFLLRVSLPSFPKSNDQK